MQLLPATKGRYPPHAPRRRCHPPHLAAVSSSSPCLLLLLSLAGCRSALALVRSRKATVDVPSGWETTTGMCAGCRGGSEPRLAAAVGVGCGRCSVAHWWIRRQARSRYMAVMNVTKTIKPNKTAARLEVEGVVAE